jgi:cysteine-rich repeat protein
MCTAPANGVATCNGTTCGFTCNSGYMASGATCIPIAADTCGNGTLDPAEGCEDDNNTNNDGCSSTCTVEPNVFREACGSTAAPIPIRSGQTLRFRGSTMGRMSEYMMCGTGPDVVFSVRAVDGGNLRVTVVSSMSWDITLRHTGMCPGTICTDANGNGAAETVSGAVSGGSVNDFVIDGFMGGGGNFGVAISLM